MSSVLKNLKKAKGNALQATRQQMDGYKQKKSFNYKDERYWKAVVDKNGTGSAIIRFLPGTQVAGTDDQYEPTSVRKWSHGFKNKETGLWYIENNRMTLGDDVKDPCTDYNSKLWKTEDPELISQAKSQKRKLSYISNIYVVKHPGRPEDEGKVFLYQYGQKIYDKLEFKINPPEDDIDPVDVFDFWEGANFRLRVKKVESFPNYDDSSFDQSKPLSEDDEELERIFKSQHSLQAEIAPDKFKSYEELEKRLFEVLGLEKDDAEEKPKAAGPRMKPTAEAKPVAKEEAPWEDDKEEVDAETGEVTEKPALKASSGSAFFKKLKAQA